MFVPYSTDCYQPVCVSQAIVDNGEAVAETDETNNIVQRWDEPPQAGPDLTITLGTLGPALPAGCFFPSDPCDHDITFTVHNSGPAVGAFDVEIRLQSASFGEPNNIVDGGDILSFGSLAASDSQTRTLTVQTADACFSPDCLVTQPPLKT